MVHIMDLSVYVEKEFYVLRNNVIIQIELWVNLDNI